MMESHIPEWPRPQRHPEVPAGPCPLSPGPALRPCSLCQPLCWAVDIQRRLRCGHRPWGLWWRRQSCCLPVRGGQKYLWADSAPRSLDRSFLGHLVGTRHWTRRGGRAGSKKADSALSELTSNGRTKQITARLGITLHLRHGADWATWSRLGANFLEAPRSTKPHPHPWSCSRSSHPRGFLPGIPSPVGPLQGKAQEILSRAIRGELPSKKTGFGLGDQLNSAPQRRLEPGLPTSCCPRQDSFPAGWLPAAPSWAAWGNEPGEGCLGQPTR